MGIKFGNYPIKGIDVSQHQGLINWTETAKMNADFGVIKVGAGKTIDLKFAVNWAGVKKANILPIAYWYMDYYSNYFPNSPAYGLSDESWGKQQADNCWNKIKSDKDNYVFLDIENATSATALPITNYASRAQKIARAFLERMDALNGKTNGIYCSLGLLTWFGTWFKNRPLWVAWYNEVMVVNWQWVERSLESVEDAVRAKGWTGKILMWQYTSDGDIDDNGSGDGILYGMESKALDLNIWMESKEEFAAFKGNVVIPEPPTPPVTDGFWAQCTAAKSLTIRKLPNGSAAVFGYLMNGEKRLVYEISNGWYRIGDGQWVYATYMQRIDPPIVETPPTVIIQVLAVPSSSQNDDRWNNDQLGNSELTIGSDGCAVTGVDAVIAFLTGRVPNPGKLNQDLKNNGGFEGALIVWDAVTKINPNIVVDWDNFIKDTALVTEARIDAVLLSGRPVLAQVDHNPSTTSLEPHWVVINGKNSNGYVIMDSWDGAVVDLKSRYEKVLRMVAFSHVPVVPPVELTESEKLGKLWLAHPDLH